MREKQEGDFALSCTLKIKSKYWGKKSQNTMLRIKSIIWDYNNQCMRLLLQNVVRANLYLRLGFSNNLRENKSTMLSNSFSTDFLFFDLIDVKTCLPFWVTLTTIIWFVKLVLETVWIYSWLFDVIFKIHDLIFLTAIKIHDEKNLPPHFFPLPS